MLRRAAGHLVKFEPIEACQLVVQTYESYGYDVRENILYKLSTLDDSFSWFEYLTRLKCMQQEIKSKFEVKRVLS